MKVLIINGPNLNLTGTRDPDIYGTTSFETFIPILQKKFPDHSIEYRQSNHEGELIDWLQSAALLGFQAAVFNPGAYAHTSYALADTLSGVPYPVVEVHISNIQAREKFRHRTLTGAHCKGVISGLGLTGYALAITALIEG